MNKSEILNAIDSAAKLTLNSTDELRQLIQKNDLEPSYTFAHIPGSYYSPIADITDIHNRENSIWNDLPILGINLNSVNQLELVKKFESYYSGLSFPESETVGHHYYYNNEYYSFTDAIILYSFLRHYTPKHIIEVGSGFTSALMLDVREEYLNDMELTFIEPNPDRLLSLLKESDKDSCRLMKSLVQDVPLSEFESLQKGDILFIDSSHVSKTGSDLNFLLFEVIPALKKGVIIHFHDIFYPFEYPKEWIYKGYNWNEAYLLKAFLSFNDSFEIRHFAHYLHSKFPEAYKNMPLCYKNGGGNLWMEKVK